MKGATSLNLNVTYAETSLTRKRTLSTFTATWFITEASLTVVRNAAILPLIGAIWYGMCVRVILNKQKVEMSTERL